MEFKAISDVYGKIEQLLITHPGDKQGLNRDQIFRYYKKLFKAFGDRVVFVILCHFLEKTVLANGLKATEISVKNEFEEALKMAHIAPERHLIMVNAPLTQSLMSRREAKKKGKKGHTNHGQWAQDNFKVLGSEVGVQALLEPMVHLENANRMVAEQVAAATNLLIKPTIFETQGGDILVGDDYALVGIDTLMRNMKYVGVNPAKASPEELAAGRAKLVGAFKRILGLNYLIPVGSMKPIDLPFNLLDNGPHYQPFFHLDLFMTLAGRNEQGKEMVFLAHFLPELVEWDSKPNPAGLQQLNTHLTKIKRDLETYHIDHAGPQFEVIMIYPGAKVSKSGDITLYPYNNVQIEWYQGARRLYYPVFDYPHAAKAEEKNRATWETANYRAIPVDNYFVKKAEEKGALHCMTKVLKRSTLY